MYRLLVFCLLGAWPLGICQAPQIATGSTVYIEPMDGYEIYLSAAFMKKHVPLTIVADESKAAYVIRGEAHHLQSNQPAVVINNSNGNGNGTAMNDAFRQGVEQAEARRIARGSTSSSIALIDRTSSQVVFSYSVGKAGNTNQIQSAAEATAKHLREFIEKPKK